MSCRGASCASGTSGYSPTGGERHSYRYASPPLLTSGRVAHCRRERLRGDFATVLDLSALWRPHGDRGTAHPHRGATPRAAGDMGSNTTCSLSSRIFHARGRQPQNYARRQRHRPATAQPKSQCFAIRALVRVDLPPESPAHRFKTHNGGLPNGLTSSRSIENGPAATVCSFTEVHRAGAFPIQP